MELEAYGRIASAVGKTRGNRASSSKKQQISAFQAQFHRLTRLKPDRLLGEKDSFAYLSPDHFFPGFSKILDKQSGLTRHHEWLTKHASLIGRSKEDFIRHNREKYGLPLAIWVVCEIWDFGTLSTLFAGMQEADQDAIASKYGIANGRLFASWLRSLNYLRNVCAHHSRLWNRNIIDQPKLPTAEVLPWVAPFIGNDQRRARPYLLFCITKHLLDRINPSSSWGSRFLALLGEFPSQSGLSLEAMGVLAEDRALQLWPKNQGKENPPSNLVTEAT